MTTQTNKTHPILITAAIAVIIASTVVVASMMGWLPNSFSKNAEPPVAESPSADSATRPELAQSGVDAVKQEAQKQGTRNPEEQKQTRRENEVKHPQKVAANEKTKANTQQVEGMHAAKVCSNCGIVDSVRAIEQPGEGTGLGAIAGGVAGALIGSQIGQGKGNTVATIAGAAGGAYAGHQVEKSVKKTKHYEITVRMENGHLRTFSQPNDSGLMVGDKVKVVDGNIVRE